jgi:PAS domain S-box-containing protein
VKDDHETNKAFDREREEWRSVNAYLKTPVSGNISAGLAAEEALRYAESIVETVREPLLVLDADLKIISANRHFYTTFHVIPSETLGYFIYDLGNNQWDIPRLRELLEEILPEKQAFDDFEVVHDFQDIGHKVMLLNARQVYRKDIDARMILLAIEDITERKRLEALLTESEERFRRLFETASDGIVLLEKGEGKITHANPATEKMMGYTREESIGNKLQDIGISLDLGDFQTTMENLNKSGMIQYDDVPAKTKTGQHIDTDIYLVDRARLVQCNIRDITERKRAEVEKEQLQAELMQAQKMESVGRLAGGVAHDFNNKLSVILGYTELAMELLDRADPIYQNLQQVMNAGNHSVDIVRQLLAFARKQIIAPEVLDINETMGGTLKMLRHLIGEDIDLIWSPGHGLAAVKMDPSQVDQILANLCVNARDAISGVGKVTIETRNTVLDEAYCAEHAGAAPGEYVMLAVSDNGCGMDRETQEYVFEPFFTTKEVGKGTGLGLATVYGIVKQNNGFIEVASEPGKGTAFRIYLPRHGGKAEEKVEAVRAGTPQGRGETILVVEDDVTVLYLTERILDHLGYAVLTSASPAEALSMAGEYQGGINLLLIDVILPEMSGMDLAGEMLKIRPTIRILFMSGYTADIVARQGVLEKGVHFIQKPFTLDSLARKVREAMGSEE